jgi:hypothetical protein
MRVSIITVSYDKDLEFLKYNLKSIKKFCKGYYENIVVIYDYNNDCVETQQYLDSVGQKYFINYESNHISNGYIRQQYIKLHSEKYVSNNSDYICHVDSDNIFISEHEPTVYFKDGLPVVGIMKWADMPQQIFKPYTDKALGFESDYNFMRRLPLVYHKNLFKQFRNHIENKHGELLNYMKLLDNFSEFNALGAFAYKFQKEAYYWIDTHKQQDLWEKLKVPCLQFSNRSKDQPNRYVDLSIKNNTVALLLD